MNPLNSVQGSIITGFIIAVIVIVCAVALGMSPGSFHELGLARWFHILSGITWIGLLYYFNLVQTPGAQPRPIEHTHVDTGGRGRRHARAVLVHTIELWGVLAYSSNVDRAGAPA